MGTSNAMWFDDTGRASTYNGVPLRTIKKAFFTKGKALITLGKLVINSVVYDFTETAQNGVVICPTDYSAIEFISPDGRIDYASMDEMTLHEALTTIHDICSENPIPSWDAFMLFLGENSETLDNVLANIATVSLVTIDGSSSVDVGTPYFAGITDMAAFLEMLHATLDPVCNDQPFSMYKLDTAAFGCGLKLVSNPDENGAITTITMGFLFRE